ncbi:MAG: LPS assembly lipoprotein LptE [Desulfobaccales bacterium]
MPLVVSRWMLAFLLIAALGCGYRPVGSEPAPLAGKEPPTLAVPLFKNRSAEVNLEALFANALTETLAQSRSWRLTSREENADLVLEGEVTSVEYASVAFFDIDQSLVRRVTIRVDLALKERGSGKVIWKEREILTDDYPVEQRNYLIGEQTKAMGIRRGAHTLARRVLEKLLLVL